MWMLFGVATKKDLTMTKMEFSARRACLTLCMLAVGAGLVGGCATGPDVDKSNLLRRATEYWALVKVNDNLKSWAYESISKDPNAPLETYLKKGGIVYGAVEVRGVREITPDTAIVDVWMRYSVPQVRVRNLEAISQDEWKKVDGIWMHVLRKSVMFPSGG